MGASLNEALTKQLNRQGASTTFVDFVDEAKDFRSNPISAGIDWDKADEEIPYFPTQQVPNYAKHLKTCAKNRKNRKRKSHR